MINEKLEVGDRVMVLHMEGEMISPGVEGTVISASKDPFEKDGMLYSVRWDNGSTLSLVSVVDAWRKIEKKSITESNLERDKWFMSNVDIPKNFKTKVLTDYLIKLRDSGIVNMFGAAPYLYIGSERIKHEHHYDSTTEDNEEYEELLELADESQSEMIKGVIKILESEKKEVSVDNINRYLRKYATKIVTYYMHILS